MLRSTTQYCAAAIKRYFAESLHREDYYSQGTEIPGVWNGVGSELIGLKGPVSSEQFYRLTENLHPFEDRSLTPRTKPGRRVGYDLCFNVPKSVSAAYVLTRDENILWAFRKSVWDTMREIEAEMKTRVRLGGANHDRATGNMVWAEYIHLTTRPVQGVPDPLLHLHCFVFNCTFDKEEKRWKAGQFVDIQRQMPVFQASCFSRLAANLVEVGYTVRRTEHAFEIDGVPETVIKRFSRRTEYIESLAADLGFEDKLKASLGARTRERKRDEHSMDQLREIWAGWLEPEELAAVHSLGQSVTEEPERKVEQDDVLESLRNQEWSQRADARESAEHTNGTPPSGEASHRPWGPQLLVSLSANNAVKAAAAHLFRFDAVITESRLREAALKMSYGKATPGQIADAIRKRPELVERTYEGNTYITTREAIQEERFLVQFAKEGHGAKRPLAFINISLSGFRLNTREREVLRELLGSRDRVTLFKHTGPSRRPELSRAAMTAVQESGYKLFVAAASTVSARQAEQDYGLKRVHTVQQLLDKDSMPQGLAGWGNGLKLIWVEDAGRLGTKSIAALARVAKDTGARLLLSGDAQRGRSHERGDPFRLLRHEAGLSTVEHRVMRDKRNALEQAVHAIQTTGGVAALAALQEAKLLHIAEEGTLTQDAARYFVEQQQLGRSALLVTPGLRTMGSLIKRVREQLREHGLLTGRDRSVLQLRPRSMSDSMKRRSDSYRRGLVIEFHRPSRGFRSGDRTRVLGVDPHGGVWVWSRFLTPERLNLRHGDRFTVSEARRAHLAVGDRIRVNRYTRPAVGRPLRSNTVVTVKAFNPVGDIVVDGMRILSRRFGHFEHDYVTTTSNLKGRRADATAFVVEAGEYAKSESRDVVATGEASRKDFRVFADDEEGMTNLLSFDRPVTSATDLEDRIDELDLEQQDFELIFHRTQPHDEVGFRHGR
jgi:conjugative relaxase-like TrwC/TraI family protein